MAESESKGLMDFNKKTFPDESEFEDVEFDCIDCGEIFIWSAGEQLFFKDKGLKHPPKRCKPCKKAKNERIAAIADAQAKGVKQKIEVSVICAKCKSQTTVPFYPSQGRPVFCRSCYLEMNPSLISESES